jgi:cytochrome b6-f complex iron-sulfur subunit
MNRSRITVMNATPHNTDLSSVSRRTFLKLTGKSLLAISSVLGLSGLFRFLSFETEAGAPTTFDLGPAENYPPGSRTYISKAQAFVLHTTDGYTALSAICPHLGCSVSAGNEEFDCPCHGSRFDLDGAYKQGPANDSLRKLSVNVMGNGRLTLLIT